MKTSHFFLFFALIFSLSIFAKERPISKLAVNVTVDEEPYCRSKSHCVAVNRIPSNPKLFTVQFFGRDSILTDKLTLYSTRSRKITAKNIEDLMNDGSIVIHGWYWRYSAKGVLERRSYFQNGKRDSTNYTYLPGEGNYIVTHYAEGIEDGIEQEFRGGKLVSEVRFYDGKPEPARTVFNGNAVRGTIQYDTFGLKTEAKEYYPDGMIKRIETYGIDSLRYAADSIYTEKLVSVEHFDREGNSTELFDDFTVLRPPVFYHNPDSLKRYLFENVQYPMSARMIELEAIVRVNVEIDSLGNVVDATIIPPSNPEFSYEAIRVVKNMPRWETAGIRYWDKSNEYVVLAVPFFMKYTLDKPTPYDEYWKKPGEAKAKIVQQPIVEEQPPAEKEPENQEDEDILPELP